jgi:predicted RNase H-like nuclease
MAEREGDRMQPARAPGAAGADGARGGWAVALLDGAGVFRDIGLARTIGEVDRLAVDCALILIDIPIGLPDGGAPRARGSRKSCADPRACDREARRALGRRASTVFPVPVREALAAPDRQAASRIEKRASGRKIGVQLWNIMGKIREVDDYLARQPGRLLIRETHPEVCFRLLNGGIPIPEPKRTRRGLALRRRLLERWIPGSGDACRAGLERYPRAALAHDDILDAMVLAAVARLALIHGVRTLPREPPADGRGLPMEMVLADLPGGRG